SKLFELVGTQAFELVTIKSLIKELSKELISQSTNNNTKNIINLWKYYQRKWNKINQNDINNRRKLLYDYYLHLLHILNNNNVPIIQIEYFYDNKNNLEMAMQVIFNNDINYNKFYNNNKNN